MAAPKSIQRNSNNPPSSSSASSAETAQEIKSLLLQLRKSSRQRQKQKHTGGATTSNSSERDRDDALRLDQLRKIFCRLIEQHEFDLSTNNTNLGDGSGGSEGGSASSQWKTWLSTQHEVFMGHLLDGVVDGKTTALRTYCGVLASSPVKIFGVVDSTNSDDQNGAVGMISERLLNKLIEAVVKSRRCFNNSNEELSKERDENEEVEKESSEQLLMTEESMLTLLETEFIRPHRDIQYFVCKAVHQIVLDLLAGYDRIRKNNLAKDEQDGTGSSIAKAETNLGLVAENMCRLLLMMDYVPKSSDDLAVESGAGYLFPPPELSRNEEEGGDKVEEDWKDDIDEEASDASDSSEEEDEEDESGDATTASKKRKKTSQSHQGHRKKAKLIAWQQPYRHRFAYQEAWLSVLRLPNLPPRTQKRVLQHLSTYVLSVCPSPLRFAEYFTTSFKGGTTVSNNGFNNSLASILSLHGLFILMLDHQLEYPQFYNSLYQLLHPRILYTKHRSRFLRLLSKSLSSNSMLPAYVVASFCKRLCQLALSGPPSGGLFVLALVSNLLRKHGECACLIHRSGKHEDGGLMEDVFVEDETDLAMTRALESSLWELSALERHYHPAISTLAKSIGTENDKTTPLYDMEDFMVHTYKSLFEQEKKRLGSGGGGDTNSGGGGKKKGGSRVTLTFVEPESLFTKDDVFAEIFKCS
ncbi:hypothetical protein ACHAXH_004892 [Discostella pseudostelligera]